MDGALAHHIPGRLGSETDSKGPLQLLQKARSSHYYVGVLMIAHTGLRRGEAAGIRWRDIDFTKNELTVAHTLSRIDGELILSAPKSKRSRRRVPLSEALATELTATRKRQAEEQLRAGAAWGGHQDMVMTTEMGTMVDPRNFLRVVVVAAKAAGIDDVGAHTLRHSAATAWLEAGVHIKAVADLLGHGSISATGDLYGHTTPEQAKNAVALLGRTTCRVMGVFTGRTSTEKGRLPFPETTPDLRSG